MTRAQTLNVSNGEEGPRPAPSAKNTAEAAEEAKAKQESTEERVSRPGGFANDPDDPANPNEAIERHRRKLRP